MCWAQIAILKDCRNVHVVQFLGACMHPGCTMLITELMAANAQDLIHSGKLPWREKCAPLPYLLLVTTPDNLGDMKKGAKHARRYRVHLRALTGSRVVGTRLIFNIHKCRIIWSSIKLVSACED